MRHNWHEYPPATHEFRPEKREQEPGVAEKVLRALTGTPERLIRSKFTRLERLVARVEAQSEYAAQLSEPALREEAARVGLEMRRHGFREELVSRVFALVREAAGRTLGKRHFAVQLMGGWALLRGMVAEMETGEGKTLTATLAVSAAALAGIPVHVLTVNDYLTRRDAEEMSPVYRALGLTVGCVVHDVPVNERRREYLCDITYCTNKEIVFDYLRDRLTLQDMTGSALRLRTESLYTQEPHHSRLLLRGLCFAITDEADSLLIDESRTPLIISGSVVGQEEVAFMQAVMTFVATLENGQDYLIDSAERRISMTVSGDRKIAGLQLPADTRWTGSIRKHEMIRRGLSALHLFELDKDYLVRDGKVQIIDPFTGRVMPDRSWEQGLQQLIEIKEGCEVTEQQETVARISYQRFFRRYLRLAGMTGTAREVTGEFWSVYGLPVVRIHTHRSLRRTRLPDSIFPDRAARDAYLLKRVKELHSSGRPVLIGTGSVAASEEMSRLLGSFGLQHQVLNAKNDAEEAAIVALAGQRGAVTIATNMAGRGTDIKLEQGVAELGGLHVIITELHEAARIDRQLAGRCARQGDPGSYEAILTLDGSIHDGGKGGLAGVLLRHKIMPKDPFMWNAVAKHAIVHVQKQTERYHGRLRRELFKQDVQRKKLLSFSRQEE